MIREILQTEAQEAGSYSVDCVDYQTLDLQLVYSTTTARKTFVPTFPFKADPAIRFNGRCMVFFVQNVSYPRYPVHMSEFQLLDTNDQWIAGATASLWAGETEGRTGIPGLRYSPSAEADRDN